MPGVGVNISTGIASGGQSWSAQYKPIYDAFTVKPSREIGLLQQTFVKTLYDGGIFPAKVVRLFLTGAHAVGESVVDFVDPTRKATFSTNPAVFEVNKGLTGADAAMSAPGWLDLGFNPATETDKYTRNSAGFGVYIQTNLGGNYIDIGNSDGSHTNAINMRDATDHIDVRCNDDGTAHATGIVNVNSGGFYFVTRRGADGATKTYVYKNKVETAVNSNSTGVPNSNFWGLSYNNNGAPVFTSARQNGLIIITSGLTTAEENILSDAVNAYFAAVALATWPYIKYPDLYKGYAIANPNTKFYFDGSMRYPLIGTDAGKLIGTPTFNNPGLSNAATGYSMGVGASDGISFWHNQSSNNFAKAYSFSIEFLVKFSQVGNIISKFIGNAGYQVYIDGDNRLVAIASHNTTEDDYIINKSNETLAFNTVYHVAVYFNNTTPDIPRILIYINGREQITYPQFEPMAWRSLVGEMTNTTILSIGGSGLIGYIDEVYVCWKWANQEAIQKRCWAAVYDSSFPIPTFTKPIYPNIICDSAHDLDCNDIGDNHVAIALKKLGLQNLLLINVSAPSDFAAPAAQAIVDWWGDDTVVCCYPGSEGRTIEYGNAMSSYWGIVDQFRPGDSKVNYPEDVVTWRTKLASVPDQSVYLVSSGYMTSVWRLLLSPADGISPLTGLELFQAKVKYMFLCEFIFPLKTMLDGEVSFNALGHIESYMYVINNPPVPIIWTGIELGRTHQVGPPIKDPDDYLTNPVRFGYKWYAPYVNKRYAYGQTMVMALINGLAGNFVLSYPFDFTIEAVTGDGSDIVYSQNGKHRFLRWATNSEDVIANGNAMTDQLDAIFAMDKDNLT